jgi:uncharacterized membrane protein
MNDIDINSQFSDFGKNMNLVAIMTVLTIVTGITGIIALIFLFMALGNIKMINYRLNSRYLDEFRSKYITAFVLKIVCIPFLVAGIMLIIFPFGAMPYGMGYIPPFYWFNLLIGIVPLVISFILFIISYSIEMKAWDNLKYFLEENRSMFPEYIARESIDGAEKLRTGALLNALGFLIITAIIGFIFQVIGFFKLAKFEHMFGSLPPAKPSVPRAPTPPQPPQPPVPPVSPISQPTESPYAVEEKVIGTRPKFCPNCGSELKSEGKYCPDCGSKIS